jgi:hypothetical protein
MNLYFLHMNIWVITTPLNQFIISPFAELTQGPFQLNWWKSEYRVIEYWDKLIVLERVMIITPGVTINDSI